MDQKDYILKNHQVEFVNKDIEKEIDNIINSAKKNLFK